MEVENIEKKPEIIVFAGPNGSGKSTMRDFVRIRDPYINADNIQSATHCSVMEAAIQGENLREKYLKENVSFSFETVMSTDRNLKLLQRAKQQGYFVRCFYVLTCDPNLNVFRVASRVSVGHHDVPEDKIRTRYERALKLLPEVVKASDVLYLFDNTEEASHIYKKRIDENFVYPNKYWTEAQIKQLVGI